MAAVIKSFAKLAQIESVRHLIWLIDLQVKPEIV